MQQILSLQNVTLCRLGSHDVSNIPEPVQLSKTKEICYRLSKQNKTTLRTMSSNFLEPDPSTIPCNGNLWFPGWEP